MNTELLTIDQVADLYQCSRSRARDHIVKLPGFPAPAQGTTAGRRLWFRRAVVAFMAGEKFQPNQTAPVFRTEPETAC